MCKPSQCPRFNSCSANVCPLDADWSSRPHVKGEAVCHFVRSGNGDAIGVPASTIEAIKQTFPRISHECRKTAKPEIQGSEKQDVGLPIRQPPPPSHAPEKRPYSDRRTRRNRKEDKYGNAA